LPRRIEADLPLRPSCTRGKAKGVITEDGAASMTAVAFVPFLFALSTEGRSSSAPGSSAFTTLGLGASRVQRYGRMPSAWCYAAVIPGVSGVEGLPDRRRPVLSMSSHSRTARVRNGSENLDFAERVCLSYPLAESGAIDAAVRGGARIEEPLEGARRRARCSCSPGLRALSPNGARLRSGTGARLARAGLFCRHTGHVVRRRSPFPHL
jgi:hypothetical protein